MFSKKVGIKPYMPHELDHTHVCAIYIHRQKHTQTYAKKTHRNNHLNSFYSVPGTVLNTMYVLNMLSPHNSEKGPITIPHGKPAQGHKTSKW